MLLTPTGSSRRLKLAFEHPWPVLTFSEPPRQSLGVANGTTSPFDAIRQTRADGSEFWSARDLMPMLGYGKWQNFVRCIDEAKRAAEITTGRGNLTDVSMVVDREGRGSITVPDVEMTRYGAYMVAMSCDGRKSEVAAAQAYFAIQTRVAETSPAAPAIPQSMSGVLRMATDQFVRGKLRRKQRCEILSARCLLNNPIVCNDRSMKAAIRVNHPIDIHVDSVGPYQRKNGETEEALVTFSLTPKGQDLGAPDLTCLLTLEEAEDAARKLLRVVEDAKVGRFGREHRDWWEIAKEMRDDSI